MLPSNESRAPRKLSAENLDPLCRAELLWDKPAVLRDLRLIMNLFISTKGCVVRSPFVLVDTKVQDVNLRAIPIL